MNPDRSSPHLSWIMAIPFVAVFFLHFYVIAHHAVNIPWWDEWDAWWRWKDVPFVSWLFKHHNEHVIFTTKLQIYLSETLGGGSLVALQVFNYLAFSLLVVGMIGFVAKRTPEISFWALLSFAVFLLTPINYENFTASFQSCFHFVVIFFVVASAILFGAQTLTWPRTLAASLAIFLSITSLSSGVPMALSLVFCLGLRVIHQGRWRANAKFVGFFGLVALGAAVLWLRGFRTGGVSVLPTSLPFYIGLLNGIGLGFGFVAVSTWTGLAAATVVLICLVGIWRKAWREGAEVDWFLGSLSLGWLAAEAAIVFGRVGYGMGAVKSSRYSEIGLMLLLSTILSGARLLKDRRTLAVWVGVAAWVSLQVTFGDDWSFAPYRRAMQARAAGIQCLRAYFAGDNPQANCPTLYPEPLAVILKR